MRILVTGKNGQLGWELQQLADQYPSHSFLFTDSKEGDITDINRITNLVQENEVECIINCAAYTAVDKAEENIDAAYTVNHLGVQNLVDVSEKLNVKLVHISTDYVFDGSNSIPYHPSDPVSPLGVYGNSKRKGEESILKSSISAVIIRTSWVYSSHGNNFVKTMLRLGKDREELNVVADQKGAPTYARDLAAACLDATSKLHDITAPEIHHYSNQGEISWFDFASEIMRSASLNCAVNPITTEEYPTPAARPKYSVLNTQSFEERFGTTMKPWQDSLSDCLSELGF